MKKIILTLGVLAMVNGVAMADGNAFTPLDFNDTQYSGSDSAIVAPISSSTDMNTDNMEAVGNGNIQNAILQLDNAQVDIRNDLLNCKTKYADIDAQYKLLKTERKAMQKQVRTIEKRIKEIEKAKEKIRKNML